MPSASTLAVFAAASFALIVIPGPSVLYIVSRSVAHGRNAGLISMLGVQTGALVHIAAAAAGLSALLASSAAAFDLVRFAGAAYLVGLGVQRLRHAGAAPLAEVAASSRGRLFRQGIVVNVLNPKVAIFFLAFMPQFIDPAGSAVALQVAVLGLCFIAVAIVSDGTWALLAGTAAERLRTSAVAARRMERTSGLLMIGLGALAALGGHPRRA